MARVKKDKTGWRSHGIWLRDFVIHPEKQKRGNKKDTKKWCRGKKGREHEYKRAKKILYSIITRNMMKCIKCGKEKFIY